MARINYNMLIIQKVMSLTLLCASYMRKNIIELGSKMCDLCANGTMLAEVLGLRINTFTQAVSPVL